MNPLIRWAGGKRQLLPELRNRMPQSYGMYAEPFLGGAALYFDVAPNKAILNDLNPELVNLYVRVRDNLRDLSRMLTQYQNEYNKLLTLEDKQQYFYGKRKAFNERITNEQLTVMDAALFVFLNKTCYNGLYCVNASGRYNTSFGKKEHINLLDNLNGIECSNLLKNAKILVGDFESACKNLKKGDFVYFDSPYYATFDAYQAGGFPESEHIRLAKLFKKLSDKGVYCMLSNSDTEFIKELYKDYNIDVVNVKRTINRDVRNRTGTEIIVTNYY